MRILELKTIYVCKGDQKIVSKFFANPPLTEYDDYKELISKDLC